MQGLFYLQLYFSYYVHITVVTIAQYTCNRVLKGVLKLSTYRLQIQLCKDQGICGKLKESVRKYMLRSLRLTDTPVDSQGRMHGIYMR